MNRFADMLSYLRRREGLSQQELAEKLGLAKSTISMYENGARKPSFEMLEAIADYFNINMDTLVGSDKPAPGLESELDEELIRLLTQLTPEEDQKVLAFVQGLIANRKA